MFGYPPAVGVAACGPACRSAGVGETGLMTADVETIVVGAGAVGLAVARALAHGRPRGHGAGAARPDRLGDLLAQQRGDPRRHLLSAGQPARHAVRARQGAAVRLLRREQRAARALRQAAGGHAARASCPSSPPSRRRPRRTASPTWSRSAATRHARWSRSSPALAPCSRRRPASSTATATCWRSKGTSRATAARWCCAARSSASSARPMGCSAWRPAATIPVPSPAATWSCRPACTPPSWRAR